MCRPVSECADLDEKWEELKKCGEFFGTALDDPKGWGKLAVTDAVCK